MQVPNWVKAEITARLAIHTAQAIGGVITYAGVQPQNGLSVDDLSTTIAGVVIQTATVLVAQLAAKIRARRARRRLLSGAPPA